MMNTKAAEWVLRIAVAGEFLGHGVFALQGKASWFKYFQAVGITGDGLITQILFAVGMLDVLIATIVLVKPIRIALLWAAFWGFVTALIRPIGGDPIWDFIERFANIGAPLALLMLRGIPQQMKEWFK